MTIGIYALYWEEQDLIYIGQSQNIEERYLSHIRRLKIHKHSNYKVQNAYVSYGSPELVILEQCTTELCNALERQWTLEFDSINQGLNIVEAGSVGYGPNSSHSKYSKFKILKVFSCLLNTKYTTQSAIANRCGVDSSLVSSILNGITHTWLKNEYPEKYNSMKKIVFQRTKRKIPYPNLVSPSNEVYFVENVNKFAKLHNLDQSALSRVLNGKAISHKGWTRLK